MQEAIQNKRYILNCIDSDGIEKPVTSGVFNSEILFGPKGAVSQSDYNDWKRIKFILRMDDVVFHISSIESKK